MQPITKSAHTIFSAISFTAPTSQDFRKTILPLKPLVMRGTNNEIIWNLDQDPSCFSEFTMKAELFEAFSAPLKKTRKDLIPIDLKQLEESILKTGEGTWVINPKCSNKLIYYIEELFTHQEHKLDATLFLRFFESINRENQFKVTNDTEAYFLFYLCTYSMLNSNYKLARKLLSVIKNYIIDCHKEFEKSPILKKLTFILLCKENPALALQLVNLEIANSTPSSDYLLITRGYILHTLLLFNDSLALLKTFEPQFPESKSYLKLCFNTYYRNNLWEDALKIGEKLIDQSHKLPFQESELQAAHIITNIYRHSSMLPNDNFIIRYKRTWEVMSENATYIYSGFFPSIQMFTAVTINFVLFKPLIIAGLKFHKDHKFPTPPPFQVISKSDSMKFIINAENLVISLRNKEKVDPTLLLEFFKFDLEEMNFQFYQYMWNNQSPLEKLKVLNAVIKINPLHLHACAEKAAICLNSGKLHEASELIKIACTHSLSPRPEWLNLRSQCLNSNLNHTQALDVCHQLIRMEPDNPSGYLELARTYALLKDDDKVKKNWELALSKNPDPVVRLKIIKGILKLYPVYPSLKTQIEPLLKTQHELDAYYLCAQWHLAKKEFVEAAHLQGHFQNSDPRLLHIRGQIAILEKGDIEEALRITQHIKNVDQNSLGLLEMRLKLLIRTENFNQFELELNIYLKHHPLEPDCIMVADFCIDRLLERGQICRAWMLCERLYFTFSNKHLLNICKAKIKSILDTHTKEEISVLFQQRISYPPSVLGTLCPLKQDPEGFASWDFDMDDWILEKGHWSKFLNDTFFVNNLPVNLNSPNYIENLMRKNAQVCDFLEEQSSSNSIEVSDSIKLDAISIVKDCYLLSMEFELTIILPFFLKPENLSLFSASYQAYFYYIYLLVSINLNDIEGLKRSLNYFESLKYDKPSPFFEKLKILIAELIFPSEDVLRRIDGSIDLLKNIPNHSLHFVKARILLEKNRYKESKVIMDSMIPVENPNYYKILCCVNAHVGTFAEIQMAGEKYFQLTKTEEVFRGVVPIGFILSYVYRYNRTLGNGDLYARIIKTLRKSDLPQWTDREQYLLFQTIFNFILNPAAPELSSKDIPMIGNEDSPMRALKEAIIFWWERFKDIPFSNARNISEEMGIADFIQTHGERIHKQSLWPTDCTYMDAIRQYKLNNEDDALLILKPLTAPDSLHLNSLYFKAHILFKKNQYQNAHDTIKFCLEKKPLFNLERLLLYVDCLIELKRYPEALTILLEASINNPKHIRVHTTCIRLLSFFNRFEEAASISKELLNQDIDTESRLQVLGYLLAYTEVPDVEFYEKNFSIIFTNLTEEKIELYHCLLTRFCIRCNRLTEAKLNFELSKDKTTIDTYFFDSALQAGDGDNERALETIKKSCKFIKKQIQKSVLYTCVVAEIKVLRLSIHYKLSNFQEISSENLNWIVPETPEFLVIQGLKFYLEACEKRHCLDKVIKAAMH